MASIQRPSCHFERSEKSVLFCGGSADFLAINRIEITDCGIDTNE